MTKFLERREKSQKNKAGARGDPGPCPCSLSEGQNLRRKLMDNKFLRTKNIECMDPQIGEFRCLICGLTWSLDTYINWPKDWWKCPHGCNNPKKGGGSK